MSGRYYEARQGRRTAGQEHRRRDRSASPAHSRDSRGSYRDRDNRDQQMSLSAAPELPGTVPKPKNGQALPKMENSVKGTVGHPTEVLVNHFEIATLPIVKIFLYDIILKVPASSQRKGDDKVSSAQLAKTIISQTVQNFWGPDFVFDGISIGYSVRELCPQNTERSTIIDLPGHTVDRPNQIHISTRNQGTLDIKNFVTSLMTGNIEATSMTTSNIEKILKWLNSCIRKDPATRFISRPNANVYFDRQPGQFMSLPSTNNVLEAIRGFYQSCVIRFGKLTVNLDSACSAYFTPENCVVNICSALIGSPLHHMEQAFLRSPQAFFESCQRIEGSLWIVVKHLEPSGNSKKLKFSGWCERDALTEVFETTVSGSTQTLNVNDYFRQKYDVQLKYPRLPLIRTQRGGNIPLELAYSARGERYQGILQGQETADFIRFATTPPPERKLAIESSARKLHWHEISALQTMGISVKTQMLKLPARILPAPIPKYNPNTTDRHGPKSGKWNLRNRKLFNPGNIESYGIMYFAATRPLSMRDIEDWAFEAAQVFQSMGIRMPQRPPVILFGNPQARIADTVADVMGKAHTTFGKPAQLLIFLVHGASERIYRDVKTVCETQFGVASQVLLVEKAFKKGAQYLANVALKINVKVSHNRNHIVSEPLFEKRRVCCIGADISHPSPSQLRMNPPPPSFAALTASYDKDCTSFTSIATAQDPGREIIEAYDPMFERLLNRYANRNGGLFPEAILYYRDGTSESEFQAVIQKELGSLKAVCERLGKSIKVTVIVSIKRHHTRMFPVDKDKGERNGNVFPGTVLENSPKNDIFLVAHPGLQGTCRPTRYVTLHDEIGLSANDFQRITNALCWNYARATTAVSLVSPVYYAHQACARAKFHVRHREDGASVLAEVHPNLEYTMWWQ